MKRDRNLRLPFLKFSLSRGAFTYLFLVFLSLFAAQIYKDPITNTVFMFVLLFPLLGILCLVFAVIGIDVSIRQRMIIAERNQNGKYALLIHNKSIIPAMVTLSLSMPKNDGSVSLCKVAKKVFLPPLSRTVLEAESTFLRRGVFEVGAKNIYIYDMLGIVRYKKRIEGTSIAAVSPMLLPQTEFLSDGVGDEGISVSPLEHSVSHDYADVREYRAGDSMKRIHWKLSTKSEELQVKKFTSIPEGCLFVLAIPYYGEETLSLKKNAVHEINDRTYEEALAVVSEGRSKNMYGTLSVLLEDGLVATRPFMTGEDMHTFASYFADTKKISSAMKDALNSEASESVIVYPFFSKEQTDSILDMLKILPGTEQKICPIDISDMLPEKSIANYIKELTDTLNFLSKNSVQAIPIQRREGAYEK